MLGNLADLLETVEKSGTAKPTSNSSNTDIISPWAWRSGIRNAARIRRLVSMAVPDTGGVFFVCT
jgi:hypothetical protein